MFATAFRAFNRGKKRTRARARGLKKKKEKNTLECVYVRPSRVGAGVNSILENFTLLTTTKWSNSDICVNKANPPGDCARPENSRVRERDYPHSIIDFIWLIKRLSRFPHSTSLSLRLRSNRCTAYPSGAFNQKCNLHPFMSRDWNICELIRATELSPAIIRGPALCLSS